eukprot:gnl/Dysnectes_brevis/8064_a14102_266.p1 GENE.gnl/Dysnectes_brevis/8064_a14102_266~~gnl/Dysnectes_brevis/8064_a14102_266.p1  ORF type:complete len:198 (+),score=72.35 gnl/Dysnectes_brevis/8064_a14102_266:145-738(+)
MVRLRCHCLTHCSDGWDRTSQLSSLAMFLLDPYYRTVDGFRVLVEKEWCSLGHMFATRCRHPHSSKAKEGYEESQVSPVFIQWLDAVRQVLGQHPHECEFNEDLLLYLAYHVYSSKHGTFLMDCEHDRVVHQIPRLTTSLWDDMEEHRGRFLNPGFAPEHDAETSKLVLGLNYLHVSFSQRRLGIWRRYWQNNGVGV